MINFHNFEHSSLATSLIKHKKNNWKRNLIWDFYHFVSFYNKPSLNVPEKKEKGPKRLKKPEIDHFS